MSSNAWKEMMDWCWSRNKLINLVSVSFKFYHQPQWLPEIQLRFLMEFVMEYWRENKDHSSRIYARCRPLAINNIIILQRRFPVLIGKKLDRLCVDFGNSLYTWPRLHKQTSKLFTSLFLFLLLLQAYGLLASIDGPSIKSFDSQTRVGNPKTDVVVLCTGRKRIVSDLSSSGKKLNASGSRSRFHRFCSLLFQQGRCARLVGSGSIRLAFLVESIHTGQKSSCNFE